MRAFSFGSLLRTCLAVAAPAVVGFALASGSPASAATPAGTPITNTATATYQDPGGTTYNSQSNTVTTTVQNAPSMTISPPSTTPGGTSVSDNQAVSSDTYTLTNTGNASGYFQLPGTQGTNEGVTTTGTASGTSYSVSGTAANGHVLSGTYTSLANLNTYLNSGDTGSTAFLISSGSSITITALYTVGAAASGTVTTQLDANITQPGAPTGPAGTTSATSAAVLGQYNDSITADARVDLQKVAVVGGTVAAPTVSYTIRMANGGAKVLQPVFKNALPGGNAASYSGCANSTACGIVITDTLPSYNATQLTLNGTPTVSGSGNVVIYYNGTTWSTSSAGATAVGVFIPAANLTGGSLPLFAFNNNASSQGNVTAAQASLTLTYTINGSTASGAANANAITNVVNATFGDNAGYIEGPGIAVGTVGNNNTATTAQTAPAINNVTTTLPGAAGATSAASPTSTTVLNGPNGFPGATGADSTTASDYTALSYTNGGNIVASVYNSTTPATETVPASAAAVTFTNSIQNTGNKFDTFTLSAATASNPAATALPAGWTVTFQVATTAGATANCPAVTAGTTITTVCVESGATVNYKVVYTPPASATTFTDYAPYGDAITATSGNNNTVSNVTNDEFIVGGFVKLAKSFTVAAGQPCASATTFTVQATALPGDCVQYTIAYTNVMPSGGTNDLTVAASSFTITEDGAASGGAQVAYANTWAANTAGLYQAATDTNGGVLTYFNPGPGAAGAKKFTDAIGALAAGASGNCTFKVQVQ
jgi:hypothetical protein